METQIPLGTMIAQWLLGAISIGSAYFGFYFLFIKFLDHRKEVAEIKAREANAGATAIAALKVVIAEYADTFRKFERSLDTQGKDIDELELGLRRLQNDYQDTIKRILERL